TRCRTGGAACPGSGASPAWDTRFTTSAPPAARPRRGRGEYPGSPGNVGGRRYGERVLESFHPAVRAWFEGRFPAGPTEPQAEGWREIAAGRHTLIAAPTRWGQTLAAVPGRV